VVQAEFPRLVVVSARLVVVSARLAPRRVGLVRWLVGRIFC
jgi:hypothetical protein